MATTKLLTSFGIIVLGMLAGSLTDLSGQTGGFAYVANCGSAEGCLSTGAGSISAYTIDRISGTLTEVYVRPTRLDCIPPRWCWTPRAGSLTSRITVPATHHRQVPAASADPAAEHAQCDALRDRTASERFSRSCICPDRWRALRRLQGVSRAGPDRPAHGISVPRQHYSA
jgi:hypothetical protein